SLVASGNRFSRPSTRAKSFRIDTQSGWRSPSDCAATRNASWYAVEAFSYSEFHSRIEAYVLLQFAAIQLKVTPLRSRASSAPRISRRPPVGLPVLTSAHADQAKVSTTSSWLGPSSRVRISNASRRNGLAARKSDRRKRDWPSCCQTPDM